MFEIPTGHPKRNAREVVRHTDLKYRGVQGVGVMGTSMAFKIERICKIN